MYEEAYIINALFSPEFTATLKIRQEKNKVPYSKKQ